MSSSCSSLDWVLSHWAHFTVRRFICVRVYFFCFILHSCCIIVSTVGWTWWEWDWSLILWTYLPSVLWHCWLGHLIRKKTSLIWPIMCLVGRLTLLSQSTNDPRLNYWRFSYFCKGSGLLSSTAQIGVDQTPPNSSISKTKNFAAGRRHSLAKSWLEVRKSRARMDRSHFHFFFIAKYFDDPF